MAFSSFSMSIRRQANICRRKKFARQILRMGNTFVWRKLPVEWRQDIDLALKVIPFVSRETELHILEDIPELRYNRQVWVAIMKPNEEGNTKDGSVEEVIRRYAPSWIVSDKELMQAACSIDANCFKWMAFELQTDVRFFWELLDVAPQIYGIAARTVALSLQSASQRTRHKIISILKGCFNLYASRGNPFHMAAYGDDTLSKNIGIAEWNHEDKLICRAWFEAGLPFTYSQVEPPLNLCKDPEVLLILAGKCMPIIKEGSFRNAPHEMRRDKVFMMKVLAKDPNLIACLMFNQCTGEPINVFNAEAEYFDLATFAFAISIDVVKNCLNRIRDAAFKKKFVQGIQSYIRDSIRLQDMFLQSASFGGLNDSLWHLIGEYAGAPTAAQRFLMERALAHLDEYSSSQCTTA